LLNSKKSGFEEEGNKLIIKEGKCDKHISLGNFTNENDNKKKSIIRMGAHQLKDQNHTAITTIELKNRGRWKTSKTLKFNKNDNKVIKKVVDTLTHDLKWAKPIGVCYDDWHKKTNQTYSDRFCPF
jgi:hypothetical protein